MPQLAPLSWVFLCFFIFSALFFILSSLWWSKKSVLGLQGGLEFSRRENFWAW